MGGVNLATGYFFIRQFVVAAEAELDHADELAFFFEGQVAVLKYFAFAEGDSYEGLVLRGEEEIVTDVLKLQVCRAPRPDQLVD